MATPDGARNERRHFYKAMSRLPLAGTFAVQFGVVHPLLRHTTRCRLCLGITVLLALAGGLDGCSINPQTPLSKQENALRIPWYGSPNHFDPGIFDPARASSSTPLLLASLSNAGLVKFSPDLHVIPELAVSIPTISTDGRSYTFTMRQDAHYADGRACTAADVAYSFARALSPEEHAPLAKQYLGGIEGASEVESGQSRTLSGVRVLNSLTVRIRLSAPDATFLEKLAFPVAAIISRHGSGGLGPFVQVRTDNRSMLVFAPRRNYFGGEMQIDTVRVVAVRNAATGIELYRKGQLDSAWIPPARMPAFSHHAEFNGSGSLDGYYAVAQAPEGAQLAAGLDRDRLLQGAGPALTTLQSIVPPAVPDYVSSPPSLSASTGASDPPLPVRLRVAQPGDTFSQELRASLRQQWSTATNAASTVWIVHATFLLPDPGRWLNIISDQSPVWYRSRLEQADALTNDPVSRMNMYSDAENWALSRGIIIPLAAGTLGYVTRSTVQGLDVTATGLMPANNNWSLVGIT
jgi:hypothetical protein